MRPLRVITLASCSVIGPVDSTGTLVRRGGGLQFVAVLDGKLDEGVASAEAQLGDDVAAVFFDGSVADKQPCRDLSARLTFGA